MIWQVPAIFPHPTPRLPKAAPTFLSSPDCLRGLQALLPPVWLQSWHNLEVGFLAERREAGSVQTLQTSCSETDHEKCLFLHCSPPHTCFMDPLRALTLNDPSVPGTSALLQDPSVLAPLLTVVDFDVTCPLSTRLSVLPSLGSEVNTSFYFI